jgi:hypothetical protein
MIDQQIAPALAKSGQVEERFLSSPGEVATDARAAAARQDRMGPQEKA